LDRLNKLFPTYKSWSFASVPEDAQTELTKRLKRSFDQWLRDSQRLILTKYRQIRPSGEDTAQDWSQIGSWLLGPELRRWHELTAFMAKLLEPGAEDPVTATADFLQKKSFEMQLKALTLSIPNNLPQGPLLPADTLQVYLRPQGPMTVRTTLSFRLNKGETVDGARDKKYRFVLEEGDGRLTFKPGDEFGAELRLTKGDKTWQFTWQNSRTASYAFETLSRPPNLQIAGGMDRGTAAEGVMLSVDGKFPVVPSLIPDVRRK
jgi:hypothetical protein